MWNVLSRSYGLYYFPHFTFHIIYSDVSVSLYRVPYCFMPFPHSLPIVCLFCILYSVCILYLLLSVSLLLCACIWFSVCIRFIPVKVFKIHFLSKHTRTHTYVHYHTEKYILYASQAPLNGQGAYIFLLYLSFHFDSIFFPFAYIGGLSSASTISIYPLYSCSDLDIPTIFHLFHLRRRNLCIVTCDNIVWCITDFKGKIVSFTVL